MAKLFNDKIMERYLKDYTIDDFDKKHHIIKEWNKNLEYIKGVNEKGLQSKFVTGIFERILDYTYLANANDKGIYTLKSEPTTDFDTTHPDGSLGVFDVENKKNNNEDKDNTIAVIELKGPKHNLDTKQNRSNKVYGSPVKQAFEYATKHDGCKWVIVTNMIEIRLYKYQRGRGHYERFKINDLTNEKEFKKFYFLLNEKNLVNPINPKEQLTMELSEETIKKEENISIEFYNTYKRIRIDLFEHLKENNSQKSEELLLEKAQKFLDRIIFICFCEDRLLLPNEILHKIIDNNKDIITSSETPIWDGIKGLFKMIDKGNAKHNINCFNGTLFKPDKNLNGLIIKDEFFDNVYELSDYDFESSLDVNILGHIFEQSINDIEEIKADINNDEFDKEKSKRKENGIYYTPKNIVKYIVENSLGNYLNDIKEELGYNDLPEITPDISNYFKNKYLDFYNEYEEKLKEIKILDPACGSGAFLNETFDYLLNEHQWLHEQKELIKSEEGQRTIFGLPDMQKEILKNNIFGVDLNKESVEITKLSLWLKTANKHKKLLALDDNIKCGNSLINDESIVGEKAFDWNKEFSEIINNGGFDIVLGNPPYVRQESLKEIKPYLKNNYEVYQGQADLYCYFFERGLNLLKEKGYFSFIVSNQFTRSDYGKKLRKHLLNYTIENFLDYNNQNIFKDATVNTATIVIKKDDPTSEHIINYNDGEQVKQKYLTNNGWAFISQEQQELKNKIQAQGTKLKHWNININRGILTGLNKAFIINEETKEKLINENNKEVIKPLLKGRNIKKYRYDFQNKWLLFIRRGTNINEYPVIKEHLEQFYENLKPRNNGESQGRKPGNYKWYELQDVIDYYKEFEKNKIVYSEITKNLNTFTLDKRSMFIDKTAFILTSENNINLKYLTGILNSKLFKFYAKTIMRKVSSGFQLSKTFMKDIKLLNPNNKRNIANKVNEILKLNEKLKKREKITFKNLVNKYTSTQGQSLNNIIKQSDFVNEIYSGRASKVRNIDVHINDKILTIYADKSSKGQYEVIKFEINDNYKRNYIKEFLENLTDENREYINNNYSGNLIKRILQIEIPDFNKYKVVRKVMSEWKRIKQNIKKLKDKIEKTDQEINNLVYELYNLNEKEIKMIKKNTK